MFANHREKLRRVDKTTVKLKGIHFTKAFLFGLFRYVLLIGICFAILYPLLFKVAAMFMGPDDLIDPTVKYFPREFSLDNIKRTMEALNYWETLLNTLLLSLSVALIQTFISAMVGYGLARFKFRGRTVLFGLMLLTIVIPPQTTLTPLFIQFRNLGILNTILPFILMSLTCLGLKNGLYIFILSQSFRGLPKALEESAYIDGAGAYRTFFRIVLPNARAMLITVFLFSFTWQWTESTYTSLFLPSFNVFSALMTKVADIVNENSPVIASALDNTAIILVIIPIILIYVVLQRYFVESMETSGIVG